MSAQLESQTDTFTEGVGRCNHIILVQPESPGKHHIRCQFRRLCSFLDHLLTSVSCPYLSPQNALHEHLSYPKRQTSDYGTRWRKRNQPSGLNHDGSYAPSGFNSASGSFPALPRFCSLRLLRKTLPPSCRPWIYCCLCPLPTCHLWLLAANTTTLTSAQS